MKVSFKTLDYAKKWALAAGQWMLFDMQKTRNKALERPLLGGIFIYLFIYFQG